MGNLHKNHIGKTSFNKIIANLIVIPPIHINLQKQLSFILT